MKKSEREESEMEEGIVEEIVVFDEEIARTGKGDILDSGSQA